MTGAVKQGRAQLVFKRLDCLADSGLRQLHYLRRLGEPALAYNLDKGSQRSQIHRYSNFDLT